MTAVPYMPRYSKISIDFSPLPDFLRSREGSLSHLLGFSKLDPEASEEALDGVASGLLVIV